MNETLDYIDAYFQKQLSEAEKDRFEERCVRDEDFAADVAFYISSREAVRQKLLEEKTKAWSAEEGAGDGKVVAMGPARQKPFARWLAYAAAACVTIFIGLYFLYPSATPQTLAHAYVKETLSHLDHTMDGSRDSLQQGITAYNDGRYDEALALFAGVYKAHPDNSDALQYAGRVYLQQKAYDKALAQFGELSGKKLFSNWGPFLTAVTLLDRNRAGDKEAAKALLEQVRDQHLDGEKEAGEWLRRW